MLKPEDGAVKKQDKNSEAAQLFFQKVQNKMLWAITGYRRSYSGIE